MTETETVEEQETPASIELVDGGPAYRLKKIEFPLNLPCGYVTEDGTLHRELELYPMSGYDEDTLTNDKLGDDEPLNKVVASCLKRVGSLEFSPNDEQQRPKEEVLAAEKVVQGMKLSDRTFCILVLRWVSLKEAYTHRFRWACTNDKCPECVQILDLRTLTVWPMANPDKVIFEYKLPKKGSVVRYRHLLVSDQPRIKTVMTKHKESLVSSSMFLSIVTIDGKKPSSFRDLQKLSTYDRGDLREEMDRTEGGVDLVTAIKCPTCKSVTHRPLEVDAGFFLQSSLASKST